MFLRLISFVLCCGILAPASADVDVPSSVMGMFQNPGYTGPQANTLTVSEAHRTCAASLPSGDKLTESYDSDYYDSYKGCMSQYVPFRVSGQGLPGSCSSRTVSWGECSATLPPMREGTTFTAQSTFGSSDFEGFATFKCSGSEISYLSGGCTAVVQPCEEGQVVEWDVTSPLWADENSTPVFTDRFGVVRHTPKDKCYARMPGALSGEYVRTPPTVNEMKEPARYNFGTSQSGQRCFNEEWLPEDPQNCNYIPRTCEAMVYEHPTGCTYEIPAGEHDEVFNSNSPQPQNSVGSVQAHCWDGNWEIKSSSCALSCEQSIPAATWEADPDIWETSGTTARSCTHSVQGFAERIPPGVSHVISNEAQGMNGSASYSCDNGNIVQTSTLCNPDACDNQIEANSWSSEDGLAACSHPSFPAKSPFSHGDTSEANYYGTNIGADDATDTEGAIYYKCEFGEVLVDDSYCLRAVGPVGICHSAGVTPPDNPGAPDICNRTGYTFENQMCCTIVRGSGDTKDCYQLR
jgi:hypothetical protein